MHENKDESAFIAEVSKIKIKNILSYMISYLTVQGYKLIFSELKRKITFTKKQRRQFFWLDLPPIDTVFPFMSMRTHT